MKTYANDKFGFSICYPDKKLRAGPESDAGDGLAFLAADGGRVAVSGINNALEETLASQQKLEEKRVGGGTTYRAQGKGWFVISGSTARDIFYTKTFLRDDQFISLRITYPKAHAADYAPIVKKMQSCFQPGTAPTLSR